MWIRIKEMKHTNFASADNARVKWLNENPNATANVSHKLRIKRRTNGTYDFIVWEKRDIPQKP